MSMQEIISLFTTTTLISSGSTFIAVVLFYLINHLYKKQIDHIYNIKIELLKSELEFNNSKTIEKMKSDIQILNSQFSAEINKKLEIAFRDENVRNAVMTKTISLGDDIRITLYKKTNEIFYKVFSSYHDILTDQEKIKQINKIHELRQLIIELRYELFSNYIFLGSLIDPLLKTQINLINDLGSLYKKINKHTDDDYNDFEMSSKGIEEAEKWIMENMKTYLTLNNIELSNDQIERIHTERDKLFSSATNDFQIKEEILTTAST